MTLAKLLVQGVSELEGAPTAESLKSPPCQVLLQVEIFSFLPYLPIWFFLLGFLSTLESLKLPPCEVAAVRFLVLVVSKTVPNSDNPKMSIKSPVKCGVNSSTVERVGGLEGNLHKIVN